MDGDSMDVGFDESIEKQINAHAGRVEGGTPSPLLSASLDLRYVLYKACEEITRGQSRVQIVEIKLERPDMFIVDVSTRERAYSAIHDKARAYEAYMGSEVLLRPLDSSAQTGRSWTISGSSRAATKLLRVKGTDRSTQEAGTITNFGCYARWVEDFDATYTTENDVTQLLSTILDRRVSR